MVKRKGGFTDSQVSALRAKAARYDVVEGGRTGLAVRVMPSGARTFCFLYVHEGQRKRLTLGAYRAAGLNGSTHTIKGVPYVSLADARIALAAARKKLEQGIDPSPQAVEEHEKERKAETVAELVPVYEKWAITIAQKRERSIAEDLRQLNKDVVPVWGSRKISSIRRADIITLLDAVHARGPIAANRLHALLRKLFRVAVRRDLITVSPFTEIDRPGGKEAPRERTLSDRELSVVWRAAARLPAHQCQFVRVLIATGLRIREASEAPLSEVDRNRALWAIPAARIKSKIDHYVPITPLLLELIDGIPTPDWAAKHPMKHLHLFASRAKHGVPMTDFSGMKDAIDRAVAETLAEDGDDEPLEPWTWHDLRRSFRSGLSRLRDKNGRAVIDHDIRERMMAHKKETIVGTYDTDIPLPAMRAGLEAWHAHLREITAGPVKSNVIVIQRAAS